MRRALSALTLTAALAACGFSGNPERFAVPPAPTPEHYAIPYDAVEVREVSLPAYAALEEIHVETPEGGISSDLSYLWADDPTRAVTRELARSLSAMTGARVADEPWPFSGRPEARVEVRIEEMIAGADGRFRLSGQYFTSVVVEEDASGGSHLFDLAVPYEVEAGPRAIATARGLAVRDLAARIAQDGF